MIHIYYYCPLQLHYHSGQTIQVIHDYASLAKLGGSQIFLFGTYEDEAALCDIQNEINSLPIHLTLKRGHTKWNRNLLKASFLWKMLVDPSRKLIVTRNLNKTKTIISLRRLLGQSRILMERHEDALPYRCKNPHAMDKERQKFIKLWRDVDALLLTSPAQLPLFQQEFTFLPKYLVLPNGVDISRFAIPASFNASEQKYVLTYVGQFTAWKNVELLFQSLALLDDRFHLRLAGGKGDDASQRWVQAMTDRYGLRGRVDYRAFIPHHRLATEVLAGSAALLLPLGDNVESRHFTSPMKLFEYMSTGIPVVAVDYPTVRMVTGDNSVFLSPNNAQDFAAVIRHAVNAPDRLQRAATMQQIAFSYRYEERAQRLNTFIKQIFG